MNAVRTVTSQILSQMLNAGTNEHSLNSPPHNGCQLGSLAEKFLSHFCNLTIINLGQNPYTGTVVCLSDISGRIIVRHQQSFIRTCSYAFTA